MSIELDLKELLLLSHILECMKKNYILPDGDEPILNSLIGKVDNELSV